jgi:hypothetical protein
MTFYSLPFAPERPEATEARLEAIYEAARYGLKGDSLALAAGLTPKQFRRLSEFDPLVEVAEMKGRADGELSAAKTMYNAAANGDARAALDILKHQHGWVAKQQIDVNIDQQISITGALERAQSRVIEGLYTELTPLKDDTHYAALENAKRRDISSNYTEVESAPTPSTFLTNQQKGVVDGYGFDNARAPQESTDV